MRNYSYRNNKVLSAVLSILGSAAVWAHLGLSDHEPLLLGVFAALYLLFSAAFRCKEKRITVSGIILGLVFAIFTVLGNLDALFDRRGYLLWSAIRFFGFWGIYYGLLVVVFDRLSAVTLVCDGVAERSMAKCTKVFFISFACIAVCYMLWWLYEYPGNTSPDSNSQLMQALGFLPLSNHHPVVSTMCLKLVFSLGLKLFGGDQNAALGLFTFLQLLFMSACFSYLVSVLFGQGVKKYVIYTVIAVFALLPYHGSYSVTVWKDVPFGGFLLVLCTAMWKLMTEQRDAKTLSSADTIIFAVSALGVCLFRTNGLYCFAAAFPFIIIVFGKRGARISIISALALIISLILTGPVYKKLNIAPPDIAESLSIPVQQIARVIRDGGTITPEQEEILGNVMDISAVPETYNEHISDPIKALMREGGKLEYLENNKGILLKLWLQIGLENPRLYLKAYIDQTKGYWYPDVSYWSMSTYCEASDMLDIHKDRRTPEFIGAFFSDMGFYLPLLPFGGLLFSIGLASWIMLSMFTLCVIKKKYRELLIFIPALAAIATLLIATPVYAEFRYAYGMFTALPLLGVIPFIPDKKIGENNG